LLESPLELSGNHAIPLTEHGATLLPVGILTIGPGPTEAA
jgi:hypothetical protein